MGLAALLPFTCLLGEMLYDFCRELTRIRPNQGEFMPGVVESNLIEKQYEF